MPSQASLLIHSNPNFPIFPRVLGLLAHSLMPDINIHSRVMEGGGVRSGHVAVRCAIIALPRATLHSIQLLPLGPRADSVSPQRARRRRKLVVSYRSRSKTSRPKSCPRLSQHHATLSSGVICAREVLRVFKSAGPNNALISPQRNQACGVKYPVGAVTSPGAEG